VIRLGITGKLKHTLQSTNARESMISTVGVIATEWSSRRSTAGTSRRWTSARRDATVKTPDDDDCGTAGSM
jgi:hypothetical protein